MNVKINRISDKVTAFVLIAFATTLLTTACRMIHSRPAPDAASLRTGVKKQQQPNTEVVRAVHALAAMPGWLEGIKQTNDLTKSLQTVSMFATATLRAAEMAYLAEGPESKFVKLEKVFLVHRYVFAVPTNPAPENVRLFGGWLGPHDASRRDMLWPFTEHADGSLELFATHVGYLGPEYPAIQEFDFFRKEFGRRTTSPAVAFPKSHSAQTPRPE